MELSLFDLHCDTANEMLRQKQKLTDNCLAVSLQKASVFSPYVQVMAHWTAYRLTDEEGWTRFCQMQDNLLQDPALQGGDARVITEWERSPARPTLILAVEDARILAGKPERVRELYDRGVRILTPLWKGETCIGGSHDTATGLTEFGKRALTEAVRLGMIPDISHASVESAEEIFAICRDQRRPVIASHSNAYTVCPVSRNLRDEQIREIIRSDGIIGINLYQGFLREDGNATAADALPHIEYLLEQGARAHLGLGCDMDGCDLPPDIPDVSALPHLAELMLQQNYPEQLIRDVFYGNAARFAQKHLKLN